MFNRDRPFYYLQCAGSGLVKMRQLAFVVCFLILFLFVSTGYSIEPVVIEFFFYEPCPTCPKLREEYETYLHNSQLVDDIEKDYGSKVSVKRIHFYSEEGLEKIEQYGIRIDDWNAIMINYETAFVGYTNEIYVREIVDAYLSDSAHDVAIIKVISSSSSVEIGESINITVTAKNLGIETESLNVHAYCNDTLIGTQLVTGLRPDHEFSLIFVWNTTDQTSGHYVIKAEAESVSNETKLANNVYVYGEIEVTTSSSAGLPAMFMLAFSFGFFETFSPCLIILLSFISSYTIGEMSSFAESFSKVMIFGTGFLSATLLLAVALGLVFLSMPTLQYSLTWVVCIFALVFGLNLLGVLKISSKIPLQSKPIIRKLARKYVITYAGLFLLGFAFYFLDPCIAPIFVSMMPLVLPKMLLFTLFVFSLGAIIPFIGIGIFAGSVSKLARITYKHRVKVRAVSGLILITYALYLIVSYLLQANQISF